MRGAVQFVQGKKTDIPGGGLILLALVGFWFGAITQVNAGALIMVALLGCGLGAKSARYPEAILKAMLEIKTATSTGKPVDVAVEVKTLTEIGKEAYLGK